MRQQINHPNTKLVQKAYHQFEQFDDNFIKSENENFQNENCEFRDRM